jgi:hypothetical protein
MRRTERNRARCSFERATESAPLWGSLRVVSAVLVVASAASAHEETWTNLDRELDVLRASLSDPASSPRFPNLIGQRSGF